MSSKLREALKDANRTLCRWQADLPVSGQVEVEDTLLKIKSALAEPLRNCDVGDAEEQFARFKKWCEGEFYKRPMNALTGEPCKSCPCYAVSANGMNRCNYLRWAQMPYSEVK